MKLPKDKQSKQTVSHIALLDDNIIADLQDDLSNLGDDLGDLESDVSDLSAKVDKLAAFMLSGEIRGSGQGGALEAGDNVYVIAPRDCTITAAAAISYDAASTFTVDVYKATYANFPTTMTKISADAPVIVSGAQKGDSTLTGWTVAVSAGDIIEFRIASATAGKKTRVFLSMVSV